jgi:hypothetical protein
MKAYSKNPKKVKSWQAGKAYGTRSLKKAERQAAKKQVSNEN